MTEIVIQGIGGRMGHVLCDMIAQREDCCVVAGIDMKDGEQNGIPVYDSLEKLNGKGDVIIDFSSPAAVEKALPYCQTHKMPIVVCTTGLSEELQLKVVQLSRSVPVFKSANMSMGINVLAELCKRASAVLGINYDIEIVEQHHHNKLDAPSGTALMLADAINEEMVTAYTAFSNKGVRVDPLYVSRIEDNLGNVIAEFTPSMTEVFSEQAYYRILPMLKDVIDHGTGGRVRFRYGITAPMGGKTGTTNNNSDGWFMGFTPDLVSGVWVGGEDRSIHFDGMADGQGASMALPIYGLYMQKVYGDQSLGYSQDSDFEIPEEYSDPCGGSSYIEESVTAPVESIEGIFD